MLYDPYAALQGGQMGELNGEIIRTPSIIYGTPQTYGQLKKSFGSSTMEVARKITTGSIFDLLQAQGGSTQYNLLTRDDHTRSVFFEIGAFRLWKQQNPNDPPVGLAWREYIGTFKQHIIPDGIENSIYSRFISLYVPLISDEVQHGNKLFALQKNPQISDVHFMSELNNCVSYWKSTCSFERGLYQKLVDAPSVRANTQNLDMGFSLQEQSYFVEYCFECVQKMLNGPYICIICCTSYAEPNALISHCRYKHVTDIDVSLRVANDNPDNNSNLRAELDAALRRNAILERAMQEQLGGFLDRPRIVNPN